MEQLINDIKNWIQATEDRIIIGISGHGAAGKTTFAHQLISQLNAYSVNYLNTDPYIVSSGIRKQTNLSYTYEGDRHHYKMTACHPAAHQLSSLERDIQMVRSGLDFFTIDTDYLERQLISGENQLTLIEGMCAAFIDPDMFDLTIYFYTDDDTELMRRSNRDTNERGADLADVQQSHNERRIQYKLFMHPYRNRFDVIIKTSHEEVSIEKYAFNFDRY
ncbi:uridine kinase family protein [Lentibacillus saliphilus]|uniref:uridine kinase family protein n=1 Tax=Lentibacillus saliphilus TaxID=2737028 RepID=UPI001C311274|nr:phosphoribulokinase [Lentibacillus saliphilus]